MSDQEFHEFLKILLCKEISKIMMEIDIAYVFDSLNNRGYEYSMEELQNLLIEISEEV